MNRRLLLLGLLCVQFLRLSGQTPEWIWGSTVADEETRYFRKVFTPPANVDKALLAVTCDNECEVFLNGKRVARNTEWTSASRANLTGKFQPGENVFAIVAKNHGASAGLLLRLEFQTTGGGKQTLVTDASWSTSSTAVEGWQNTGFRAEGWVAARSLGALGVTPWGEAVFQARVATPAESLTVLPGFKVELLRSAEEGEGSWVSMTTDPKGRLIISPQGNEPMLRVTLDGAGQVAKIEPIELPVRGAMGLLHAFDSLYVNGQGPDGYHLYRLTDTDGDDRYDKFELIHKWKGGPGEHGAHGIVLGPDRKLYIVCGNFVDVPDDVSPSSPHRNYADDLALPRMEDGNGFGAGRKPPGGFVVRLDPDGRNMTLFASGERNTYDIAFNPDGELFGFDSDMEWDWGAPWYRPIRVFHAVSGGDQGFREGSGKWPEYYQDSLPAVVNIGIGSPTGVRFGTGMKFPEKYERALYVMDWSYGRILAVHLQPRGASYSATFETFVKGKPLNVTDLEAGPDGAMYFTTGGRGTQSGLYRVSAPGLRAEKMIATAAPPERNLRHELETFHGRAVDGAVSRLWEGLGNADRHVRYAARIGLESQPVAAWRERAINEKDAATGLTALLALARLGREEDQVPLLGALAKWPLDSLNEELFLLKLRVIEVSFARHGIADEIRPMALERLGRHYPADSWPKNRELSQLLVALDSPDAVAKTLTLRDSSATQEEQLHYMTVLRKAKSGWNMADRRRYFAWFTERNHNHPAEFTKWFNDVGLQTQDGASLANFLKNLRTEAANALTDAERTELAGVIAGTEPVAAARPAKPRDVVQAWTSGDLSPLLDQAGRGRNFERGRQAFADAQCLACHRFAGEGGAIGPDLNGLSSRFTRADILKNILDPSAVISEQYQNVTLTLKGGDQVTGRVLDEKGDQLTVLTDPLQNTRQDVKKSDVQNRFASKLSPMPEGLLNVLPKDEVLDLIAYLESGGRKDAAAFAK